MNETHPELSALADRLRALVAEERYAEAQCVFTGYCLELRKKLAGMPQGDPQLRPLEGEWQGVLDETRRRVLAGRAHAGARLARLPKILPLYREGSLPHHTWECSG